MTAEPMSWYEEFYAGVDAMDPTIVDRLCTQDTVVRFANHDPAVGREAVRSALQHTWSTIGGLRHRFEQVTEQGDRTVIEAIVDYTLLDGSIVSLPVATAIERRHGLVAAQRIYADLAPLQAAAAQAAP